MSRKPDEFMPLNVRKYLGDTMHLTRDQHGAYLLLLMAYWMRGGPLSGNDNELATIAKASILEWRNKLRPALIGFFDTAEGVWRQKRAEEELDRARRLTEAKSKAGKIGAANKWQTHGRCDGTAMAGVEQTGCQNDAPLPIPRQVEKILPAGAGQTHPKKPREDYPEPFQAFWKAYPTDENMSKKLAFKQWQRLSSEQREKAVAAVPAFRTYCDKNKSWYRPIYAERFLSQEKFEGYASAPALSDEEIAANKDRADRLMKRGKYDPMKQGTAA